MAARDYDPSYINRYLMRLAAAFHKFYNACRIKGEDEAVIDARLARERDPSGACQRSQGHRLLRTGEDVKQYTDNKRRPATGRTPF